MDFDDHLRFHVDIHIYKTPKHVFASFGEVDIFIFLVATPSPMLGIGLAFDEKVIFSKIA